MDSARPATNDDVDALVALLERCIAETPHDRGGQFYGVPERFVAPERRIPTFLSASGQSAAFVGTYADVVVGIALISFASVRDARVARVEELYVEPAAREVGVGEALLDACVAWAERASCSDIEIDVLPGSRSAKNLGERSGFRARRLTLHRSLSPTTE